MKESISYCCIILSVTIILISNVSVTIASKHDEHDDSHDSKDIFDLLHHEIGGKNESVLTSNDLVKLYDELHLKMCTPTVQQITKADDWCNTVS